MRMVGWGTAGTMLVLLGLASLIGAHEGNDSATRVHLCVNKKGKARFVPAAAGLSCRKSETALHVNASAVKESDVDSETAPTDAMLAADGAGGAAWKTMALDEGDVASGSAPADAVLAANGAGGAVWKTLTPPVATAAKTVATADKTNLVVEPAVDSLGSITVVVPADGHLLVGLELPFITFGDDTAVRYGLGSTNAIFDWADRTVGHLDGAGTDRRRFVATTSVLVPVTKGTSYTFYANAARPSVYAAQSVNVSAGWLNALFVPGSL